MKEAQEIVDYLEIDSAEKLGFGSRLILTNDGFSVLLKATMDVNGRHQIEVEFIPPKSHYEN